MASLISGTKADGAPTRSRSSLSSLVYHASTGQRQLNPQRDLLFGSSIRIIQQLDP